MSLSPMYIWAIIGIILIIADLLTLTFFLIFLGVGALVTSVFTVMGVTTGINSQLICFAVSSLITMVLFRGLVKKMFGKKEGKSDYAELVGQKGYVADTIPAGHEGKVSYRGSVWIAFSDCSEDIPAGTLVTIESIDGIKLKVKSNDLIMNDSAKSI
jgi:membrane protein implicated in regulation of membrane protease activity